MSPGKPSKRKRGAENETTSFSTSQGRANFARALETTAEEKTIVGFARYSTPVAVLAPIEAVRMLAGQSGDVDPAVRARIVRMAKLFLASAPPQRKPRAKVAKAKKKAAAKKAARPARKPKKASAKRKTGKRKKLGKSA
ncbi:hypothetical protein [Terricaulis sp.]|uniref:hypothetical protein n=1 Tax=Terricaulis sp. TaxID=2768686 RepID=UPI002AC52657|nr:hypothetical protein [Terricaulis sp.]MDZ4692069.1 hypothetical protein [Terricaulis sp.]